jgi:hypothetical protein
MAVHARDGHHVSGPADARNEGVAGSSPAVGFAPSTALIDPAPPGEGVSGAAQTRHALRMLDML